MEEMEEIYFRMHAQLLQWFQRLLPAKSRLRMEVLLFVVASHLLLLCCLLHGSFAGGTHGDCLAQYFPAPSAATRYKSNSESSSGEPQAYNPRLVLRIQVVPDQSMWLTDQHEGKQQQQQNVQYRDATSSFVYAAQKALLSLIELQDISMADTIGKQPQQSQLFSQFDSMRVVTLHIPRNSPCFALKWIGADNPLWTLFLDHVLGYDTILMNHIVRRYGAKGFFYRESVKVASDLHYGGVFNPDEAAKSWLLFVALKFKVIHTILFLFFIITALVAFVLMETQKRMITFTGLFQNRSQLQIPFANLVLAYFAQSLMFVPVLVGMLFFLFELYKDHLLAFAIMTIMWVGESFSVISVRSQLAQMYFPPLFFCLFTLFHLYFFSFPFGFSYIVLATMSVLLALLMLFFWNNFEIPALNRGQVSALTPREPFLLSF